MSYEKIIKKILKVDILKELGLEEMPGNRRLN